MELTSLFGLPAHPLLVHLPVVLIPLTAAVAVLAIAWRRARRPLSLVVAGLAIVSAIGAILAAGSGETLEENLPEVDEGLVDRHAELGEGLRIFAILFAVAAIAFAVHHWPERLRISADGGLGRVVRSRQVFAITAAALVLTAGLSTVWTVRAGHSGAEAVWKEEWSQRQAGGDEGRAPRVGQVRAAAIR